MSATFEQAVKDNDEALKLLVSDEWKQYIDFLNQRAERLQAKVNEAVEKDDIVEARIALALLRDNEKQAQVFKANTQRTKDSLRKKGA